MRYQKCMRHASITSGKLVSVMNIKLDLIIENFHSKQEGCVLLFLCSSRFSSISATVTGLSRLDDRGKVEGLEEIPHVWKGLDCDSTDLSTNRFSELPPAPFSLVPGSRDGDILNMIMAMDQTRWVESDLALEKVHAC